MQAQHGTLLHCAAFIRRFIESQSIAEKRQNRAVHARGRFYDVRNEPFARLLLEIAEILAASGKADFSIIVFLHRQGIAARCQLAFHVAAQIEVTAVRDAFELAKFALQKRVCKFYIGRSARIVAELVLVVLPQTKTFSIDPEIGVPAEPAISPVPIPGIGLRRMTEELDLHLLELAGAKDELTRGNFVAEASADLRYAEGQLQAR